MRFHHAFLAPWIVLSVPPQIFLGFGLPFALIVGLLGLLGMFRENQALVTSASVALLGLVIGGKVGTDLVMAPGPDTAILLAQFLSVIFFMEASRVVLSFSKETTELAERTDRMSLFIKERLSAWIRDQLSRQALLVSGAFGLSLLLLVLGGIANVSVNQLAFSAVLVLLVIGSLLFLLTQRREPETRSEGLH